MTLFGGGWPGGYLAMFTACFDASGSDHDQPILMVAGFVSSASDWVDFERKWKERLKVEGIECFHAVEFAHSKGQFSGWRDQEDRRRKLLRDLLDIIIAHVYRKFGCGVNNGLWTSNLSPDNLAALKINAYALCAMVSSARVDDWAVSERIRTQVEMVFEDGDVGQGVTDHYLSSRGQRPIFRPKRDRVRGDGVIVPAFVPLQAADLLAYELWLGMKKLEMDESSYTARYALSVLSNIPGEINYLDENDFANFDGVLRGIRILAPETTLE